MLCQGQLRPARVQKTRPVCPVWTYLELSSSTGVGVEKLPGFRNSPESLGCWRQFSAVQLITIMVYFYPIHQ